MITEEQKKILIDAYNDNKTDLERVMNSGDCLYDSPFEAGYDSALEFVFRTLGIKEEA